MSAWSELDEIAQLKALIKLLCSGTTIFGSESFNRIRDQINPEARELLLNVLNN